MIEKLQAQFPNMVVQSHVPGSTNHYWFVLKDGTYLGIPKQDLNEKDKEFISIFLTPLKLLNNLSLEQLYWQKAIEGRLEEMHGQKIYQEEPSYRLIHFYLHHEVDFGMFEEAVSAILLSKPVMLWHSQQHGIIIEKIVQYQTHKEEFTIFRDTVTTDFYTDIDLYVGQVYSSFKNIHGHYKWEKQCFELARTHSKRKGIFQFFEVIPLLLLHSINTELRERIHSILLQELTTEDLKTIKIYIESGLNVSLASKTLFMHRNSLQYRVDKFIEKTGIDIKSFQGALVVYLAILSYEF
jgi:DNA-binding PucR family transcriptional regulator